MPEILSPINVRGRGVLEVSRPTLRTSEEDAAFAAALRDQFPAILQSSPPADVPPGAPRLVVQSTASRLVASGFRAEFETAFYDDYAADADRCRGYLVDKLRAVRSAWEAVGGTPSFAALIFSVNFPFEEGESPAAHILQRHLAVEADPDTVQDAQARVAVREADKYFINVTISNYESRALDRPVFPGQQAIMVKPWDGVIEQRGVEATVDLNNRLDALTRRADPEVNDDTFADLDRLLQHVLEGLPQFVADGRPIFNVERQGT